MHPIKLLSCLPTLLFLIYPWIAKSAQEGQSASEPRISGPFGHENLIVYLVHSRDLLEGRTFLTLPEALKQKKARVYETGSVNQLAIENLSEEEEIFIQAGEIVRGGKQDRVLAVDLILGPKSGKVPIGAFCVEQGRWSRRGSEGGLYFVSADNAVHSNALKLAVRKNANQSQVWRDVAVAQRRLAESLQADVTDPSSASSLELTLESGEVQATAKEFIAKLLAITDDKDDVVGVVFAINEKLYCADAYASPALFRKLWPKVLESGAIEAIASRRTATTQPANTGPTIADVHAFLAAAEDGKATVKDVSSRIRQITRESNQYVMFETIDLQNGAKWIHRSYVAK